ncbi:MAG: hypothetical protein LBK41_03655 [Clostridiales bacterium]|jgi:hypothetical protein|nr:hypothetical protein [Clostridiales bacterium]
MSMRPIDLKAALGNSYEVNRASGADGSRAGMQQAHFARQMDKETVHAERFVRESDKGAQTNPDGRGNGSGAFGGAKKKKKNPEAAAALSAYKSSSIVDIRV